MADHHHRRRGKALVDRASMNVPLPRPRRVQASRLGPRPAAIPGNPRRGCCPGLQAHQRHAPNWAAGPCGKAAVAVGNPVPRGESEKWVSLKPPFRRRKQSSCGKIDARPGMLPICGYLNRPAPNGLRIKMAGRRRPFLADGKIPRHKNPGTLEIHLLDTVPSEHLPENHRAQRVSPALARDRC